MPRGELLPAFRRHGAVREAAQGRESRLLVLVERVGLGPEVAGRRAVHKVARKRGLEERAENDVGAPEGRQRQPQEEDELEGVVEGEPVDNANQALDDAARGSC